VEWKTVAVAGTTHSLATVEEAFWDTGAVSVSVIDAEDQPIYEPGPGEEPVWENVVVSGLYDEDVDLDMVRAALLKIEADVLFVETLGDRVWEREWLTRFHPMQFGQRLWVCPSGREVTADDAIILHLDPGLAFGTGTHATTHLCLEWLDGHVSQGDVILDFGCGSGILGIAALLLGAQKVRAIDNDPQALVATLDNATRNGVNDGVQVSMPEALQGVSYDTVVANILAQPLIDLAETLSATLKPGGHLLLSGIMSSQKDWVKAAYTNLVFVVEKELDGWVCLAAKKPD
jgi:ribosomal protein L11 methyltransferase